MLALFSYGDTPWLAIYWFWPTVAASSLASPGYDELFSMLSIDQVSLGGRS